MKKILVFLLVVVLAFSLVACGSSGNETQEESGEEAIIKDVKDTVSARIVAKIVVSYDTVGSPTITHYVDEIDENEYEVTGKVTVRDKYGDTYTGKYDAIVIYDPVEKDSRIDSFELGSLYKN